MLVSQLNTSMLDDIKSVLGRKYIILSDKYDKRIYLSNPKLSWNEDRLSIQDSLGFSADYYSSCINIGSNSLFIYSEDRVIQDMYVGYDLLSERELNNYNRFIESRILQISSNEEIDLSFLHHSLRIMIEEVIDSIREIDYLKDSYIIRIGKDKYDFYVKNSIYNIVHYDEEGSQDNSILSYSYRELIYNILILLSDNYGFDIDKDTAKIKILGITSIVPYSGGRFKDEEIQTY